jgi:hypothetical protein
LVVWWLLDTVADAEPVGQLVLRQAGLLTELAKM